ncbi:hypothetical protein ONS95_014019 [Cadophora gregata]|uniref:uncharacterized protein n=1 Tax=Cadophora gregata TaxID=51156 RepID=UPI0026DDCB22|nr:uncharacterized protein ONS95_014019 [Cadophora gregata]KAK0113769.1 hypothetical protein ONS96_014624 [Cadophora gregata f. sp. sojae]KAK0114529.1 hypothetical protein ONS95_014019 [Cadophora gregata]
MHRSTSSRSKWMDVLGFDQPAEEQGNRNYRGNSLTYLSDGQESAYEPVHPPLRSPTYTTYPRFPRDVMFCRFGGDILLSPSSPAPSPNDIKPLPAPPHLFYITIQNDLSSQISTGRPDLVLHKGPSKASTVMSFARFHSVTQMTDITLCPTPPRSATANFSRTNFSFPRLPEPEEKQGLRPKFKFEQLGPASGIFSAEKYEFCHTFPWNNVRERFEWRYTSGPFVRTIYRDSGGLKLIRVSTGDAIAVYAGLGHSSKASNPSRVLGMFRFLKGDSIEGLGEEFEVLAIMSILSLVERGRRVAKAHNKAFGIK